MIQTNKIIVWKKWIDPFDIGDELIEDEGYTDDFDKDDEDDKPGPSGASGPVLVGPMGVIPLNEHNMPSKVFRFWMGHTSFDLRMQEKDIIEAVPGVETLEIFTRYRFRMSVGIAFDEQEVMKAIDAALTPVAKPEVKTSSVDKLKTHLQNHYKYWAIFLLPNGEVDYKVGDTQDSVKEKIAGYPSKAEILTSWEVSDGEKKTGNGRGIPSSIKK